MQLMEISLPWGNCSFKVEKIRTVSLPSFSEPTLEGSCATVVTFEDESAFVTNNRELISLLQKFSTDLDFDKDFYGEIRPLFKKGDELSYKDGSYLVLMCHFKGDTFVYDLADDVGGLAHKDVPENQLSD